VSLDNGWCEVPFDPANGPDFRLYTHLEEYADMRLCWQPKREPVPDRFAVRLVRPVLVSGRVLDAEGTPVVGASVGWNHELAVAPDVPLAQPSCPPRPKVLHPRP
jgi:hypothetical protein